MLLFAILDTSTNNIIRQKAQPLRWAIYTPGVRKRYGRGTWNTCHVEGSIIGTV